MDWKGGYLRDEVGSYPGSSPGEKELKAKIMSQRGYYG
jgi:hypothetical protein